MKRVRAWWPRTPRPGNLGDVCTPYLIRALGYEPVWSRPQYGSTLLGVGSIVRQAHASSIVWGAGLMRRGEIGDPQARYCAVRGPLTRAALLEAGAECPDVLGDPAMLLPRFYEPRALQRSPLGVVPHYVDIGHVHEVDWSTYGVGDPLVISPLTANPEAVIDAICSCDRIVSSSLHGIVIATAYGIPCEWSRLGNRLDGDDVKFADFAASLPVDLDALEQSFPHDLARES